MRLNGRYVNPLQIQVPPAEPLSDSERPAFAEARRRQLPLLEEPLDDPTLAPPAEG